MASRPILLSVWASTLILGSAAQSFKLGTDVTSFIPSCARSCFQTYVDTNFKPGTCGSSLSCLCSQTGASGYTLGELALICMSAEVGNKVCVGEDAKQEKVSQAYGMCVGQSNAAPITHSSIVATVSLSPDRSKPSPVLAPSPTAIDPQPVETDSTTSILSVTPSLPTTLVADTNTRPPGATRTSLPPEPSTSAEARPQPLSTIQIVAIVVGIGGGILLTIGVFLLFWCLRRRKREQDRSDGGSSKLRDSWSVLGPKSVNGSPQVMQISKPVLVERQQPDFVREVGQPANVRPDAIGLAMSQPISSPLAVAARQGIPTESTQNNAGPAVPEKPRLTLHIPKEGAIPPPPPLKHAPPNKQPQVAPKQMLTMPFSSGRDSVVTEFAEDGEGTLSAGGAQIWRQPKSADPHSATTYYVADKVGNWVLQSNLQQSNVMELEGSSPMDAAGASSRRTQPPGHAMTTSLTIPTGPPARVAIPGTQTSQASKMRATSSIYSTTNFSKPVSSYPVPPIPSIEISSDSRRNSRAMQLTKGLVRSDTVVSGHSVTTIASSTASGEFGDIIDPTQKGLSPVVESPKSPPKSPVYLKSPEGVSPVTYPKIPGRQDPKLQVFPFPSRGNQERRPGQGAPGFLVPANIGDSNTSNSRVGRSLLIPNPNPNRNPGQIRTGSPNMPQGQQQQQRPQLPQLPQQLQQPTRHASPRPHRDPRPALVSANFASAPSCSLASKRLGADRAAALALQTSQQAGFSGIGGSQAQGQWQKNGQPGVYVEGMGHVPLPSTPGWEPKLTPKKMGGDLFLSVG